MCADIEEIASKTGSFKTYALFVKMLLTSLKRQSGTVVSDLLTYRDLHQLQQGTDGQSAPVPASASQPDPSGNKRYLILTYVSEFDRVHYPLPLHYVAAPDPDYLKSIIARLRSEAKRHTLVAAPYLHAATDERQDQVKATVAKNAGPWRD